MRYLVALTLIAGGVGTLLAAILVPLHPTLMALLGLVSIALLGLALEDQ